MTELEQVEAVSTELVIPTTGERYDLAIPSEAAQALRALNELEQHLRDAKDAAKRAIVEESHRLGSRTLQLGGLTVKVAGGPGATSIDAGTLAEDLRAAGCPEERVDAAVKTLVDYKVDRSVCRQLATNPDYKDAIERATSTFEKPYSVTFA